LTGFVAFIRKEVCSALLSLWGCQDIVGLNPLEPSADRCYRLRCGVRVRKEKFGLLFYNRNGPKLTFVHSGPWIRREFFSGRLTLREWLQSQSLSESEEKILGLEAKISKVLSRLVDKGLIIETMADP